MHLFAVLALAACAMSAYAQQPPKALVDRAKAHITKNFHDPYSAVVEGVYYGVTAKGDPVLCGTVNGKNLQGAYVGRKRFFYLERDQDKPSGAVEGDGLEGLIPTFCDKRYTGRK